MQPVAGVKLGCAAAGVCYQHRDDLTLIQLHNMATLAAVFTQNGFCAAPVVIARDHVNLAVPRYLLVNAGNANAGTGKQGMNDAIACCQAVSELGGCDENQVLPFSTGVIGEYLPVAKIVQVLPVAFNALSESGWQTAAKSIMTTDTVPKGITRQADINGHTITVTGIAKGVGMICPNMATMLSYVATDAAIPRELLQECLEDAASQSFNRISIDGDTSTNDACVLIATGQSSLAMIDNKQSNEYQQFYTLVLEVVEFLAKALIRDGEGATKLVTVAVEQGVSEDECQKVAYTIAHSPLVKTALFACDPNWGRILAAVGRAGLQDLDVGKVKIFLDDVCIVSDGGRDASYTEARGQQVMDRDEVTVTIHLGRGAVSSRIWTCDLSYDYVRINAEYRT
ncbi:MAG: bifunctional glutamate N-acetyltransferase/amino-acid acetyltransferase ArgJ [Gammaproteobacteria bacterium]|nr:bifunctional glutamate N-acetyltransferase/amino-acid acetyltransferase ArgJ [Gammaproteobacteria bacterium]